MIIWGTSSQKSTVERGQFHCPTCGPDKPFKIQSVRRYFSIYFIPIIPMGEAGRYLECTSCAGTFAEEARDQDPEVENAKFFETYRKGLYRAMIVMAQADGPVNERELDSIADIMTNVSGNAFEVEDVRGSVDNIAGVTIEFALQEVREALSDDGRSMILQCLYQVAAADGPLVEEESNQMIQAGRILGFRKKAITQFLQSAET